jgi:hypothetical protein|tara:strand:+ start:27738 stop:28097 length:360 start_codon:yes stop_codon:yes gene_type:complete
MFEYIRIIRRERKSLSKKLKVITDTLNVTSIVCGGLLFVKSFSILLDSSFGYYVTDLKEFSDILFWSTYISTIFIFYYLGQFLVLGITTSILCILGKITSKEALKYTFYYRLPESWLAK